MVLPHYFFQNEFCQYEELFRRYGGRDEKIKKRTVMYGATAQEHIIYYIKSGIAKYSLINEDGMETILFFFGPGSLYPIHCRDGMFSLENGYLYLTAVTDLDAIAISSDQLEDIIRENPDFAVDCIKHFNDFANSLLVRTLLNTCTDSLMVVSSFLFLYLYYYPDQENVVALTQDDVAKITGYSRVQVTRIIAQLKAEGIVETNRGQIKIVDIQKLKEYCSDITNEHD